jgi:two-component system, NtrC family, sensor histidine kinase HydH
LILAVMFMGVALLATVWTTNRAVQDASSTLVRGQSTILFDAIRTRLSVAGPDGPGPAALNATLAALSPHGLRWLALLDVHGTPTSQAGSPAVAITAGMLFELEPGVPRDAGGRALVVFRRPDRTPKDTTAANDARPEARGRGPAPLAIEFEPTSARELLAAGRRTLSLGALAAGAFLVIGLWLVRWFLKREQLERHLEQERRLAGLGRMSAVLAHEIRNPLASLKGNAQLLARALVPGEPQRTKADLLVSEVLRLETLTNDLLDFARSGELQISDVDPSALVREAAQRVSASGAAVTVLTEDAPASWPLDAARIQQVLSNLLQNAVQASDQPVTARVAREPAGLVFEVSDRGPGIKDEDVPRVFEPFFTRRIHGTGLGLAVCKRLVDLHGGTISASSAAHGGATFTVRIPRSNEDRTG